MNINDVKSTGDKIVEIMMDAFFVAEEDATLDAEFDSLDLDSLVLAELAVLLKKEFGVELTYENLEDARTIGNVALLINESLASQDSRIAVAAS